MQYNSEQREAILHFEGPAMILAGPGSGKTAVITGRISYLIQFRKIPPSQILVITYTRAAAEEMKTRFLAQSGPEGRAVTFGTFHAVFNRILHLSQGTQKRKVISAARRRQWLKEMLAEEQREESPEMLAALAEELLAYKSSGRDLLKYSARSCQPALFRRLFEAYTRRLREEGLMDFEDMLRECLLLFAERPAVLARWQQHFTHILIDEFQDINPLQYELVRALAGMRKNLFIVGDDDQSVYRFRGAQPEIMLRFPADYPDCRILQLSVCYRCPSAVLAAAGRLIAHNKKRYEKELLSFRTSGGAPEIHAFEDRREEQEALLKELRQEIRAGTAPGRMAVLCRTQFGLRLAAALLYRAELPFTLRGAEEEEGDHWIVRDIFAYLRAGAGSRSREDWLRIINKPLRYIPRKAFPEETVNIASLQAFVHRMPALERRTEELLFDLAVIGKLRPYAAIEYIRKEIGYEKMLKEYAAERGESAENYLNVLNELQEESADFSTAAQWERSRALLREIRQREPSEESGRGILLTTMHGAKGLEFDAVFLPDVNEGVIPHGKSTSAADREEERRLFYVALTRTRRRLWIGFVSRRRGQRLEPSRFLREMSDGKRRAEKKESDG